MRKTALILVAALAAIAFHAPAFATETGTMICNGGIVAIGDTLGEVVGKCGQPATATQREQKKVEEKSRDKKIITTVTIDDWQFNFGPNQFQYQLLFENGRVARIESLGYGY